MAWIVILASSCAAVLFLVWRLRRAPPVNHDRCPFKVGLDHIDCTRACEPNPPCRYI